MVSRKSGPLILFFKAVPLARVPPADFTKEITGTRTEQRVKMNRMRLRIAQRLKEAQNVNAMLTTFNEIDMRYRTAAKDRHLDPEFDSLFIH